MQPTVGVKNALQEGRPVPRSPLVLYRGLVVRVCIRLSLFMLGCCGVSVASLIWRSLRCPH